MGDSKNFNWKLEKALYKSSMFLKKEMRERTPLSLVLGYIKEGLGNDPLKRMNMSLPYKTELEMIEAYKQTYKKDGFYTKIVMPKHKWGRTLPINYLSLSIMKRSTRHSFCDGVYEDIDMVNAQPTMLYQIAKKNNMDCEILRKYVETPKLYRETIMTHHHCDKDTAKKLPISLIMGGTYEGWLKEFEIPLGNDLLQDFLEMEREMKTIMEVVYNMNPDIKKDVLKENPNKWRNINEEKRGVMGLWCQSIERLFQETAIEAILSSEIQIEDVVPCQDGFMIPKEMYDDELLEIASQAIKDKYDIDIEFANKPFDEKIDITPFTDGKTMDEWGDLLSVKKLADTLLEIRGDYIVKNKNRTYVYYGDRWYNESDKDKPKFWKYISEDLYEYMKGEIEKDISIPKGSKIKLCEELRSTTSRSNTLNDIIKHTLCNVKEAEDFDSKPFLLGFNNGVIDLLECKYEIVEEDDVEYEEFNIAFRPYRYDDYMTMSCGYDYIPEDDDKKNKELGDVINSIQSNPEERDYLLQILASGLDGRAYQKIHLLNGKGGNGKGLLGGLMSVILGDYYHQPTNAILKDVEKANTPSPDMIELKNKRYINFKELEGNIRLGALKNLTGDGDFKGRYLHQNPETFKITATWVAEFNNPPEIDGKPTAADYRRMVNVSFPNNFTDDEDKIGKTINGITYQKGNDYYTTTPFKDTYKIAFLELLISVYCQFRDTEMPTNGIKFVVPASVKENTNNLMDGYNIFHTITKDLWIQGGDKKVGLKEMWDMLSHHQDYTQLTTRVKKQYSRDEYYIYLQGTYQVESTPQKTKYIMGLMLKGNDEEDLN